MESIATECVVGVDVVDPIAMQPHTARILRQTHYPRMQSSDSKTVAVRTHCRDKCSPAHPTPRAARKYVIDLGYPLSIGNPDEVVPGRIDAEFVEKWHHPGHQPFTAGFVTVFISGLDDDRLHSGAGREQCGGKPDRPTSHDRYPGTGHVRLARALFSTGMRKPRRKMALRTVNTIAVIHAV